MCLSVIEITDLFETKDLLDDVVDHVSKRPFHGEFFEDRMQFIGARICRCLYVGNPTSLLYERVELAPLVSSVKV